MAIFGKSDDDVTPALVSEPRIGQKRPARSNNVSVIGPTMVFKGELSADEDLIIEGHIEGTITHHKKHLTVGKQGRVHADINASAVIVLGELVGDIRSDGMVSLAKSARVTGNIYCARIVMEDGARFKGKIDMGQAPKVKLVPKESVSKETTQVETVMPNKPRAVPKDS
jgi:cytoskeletal protein CcmA (bactofilin family)